MSLPNTSFKGYSLAFYGMLFCKKFLETWNSLQSHSSKLKKDCNSCFRAPDVRNTHSENTQALNQKLKRVDSDCYSTDPTQILTRASRCELKARLLHHCTTSNEEDPESTPKPITPSDEPCLISEKWYWLHGQINILQSIRRALI